MAIFYYNLRQRGFEKAGNKLTNTAFDPEVTPCNRRLQHGKDTCGASSLEDENHLQGSAGVLFANIGFGCDPFCQRDLKLGLSVPGSVQNESGGKIDVKYINEAEYNAFDAAKQETDP